VNPEQIAAAQQTEGSAYSISKSYAELQDLIGINQAIA
jgi:hypothetical protein